MYSWMLITGDTPVTTDALEFRQSLGSFPTGVCLVTTVSEQGKREGMTINSFASVSLAPPLILWSIRDDARSADAFIGSRHFILSVLAASQEKLALHFSRPAPDKFAGWEGEFDEGIGGTPRLRDSVATFECTTYSRHQEGDHTILLGRVEVHRRTSHVPLLLHLGKMGSLWSLAESPQPQH
ncbi:MAG TPA: flavin reductase family protein [Steroidobacteraceae bacterium]|nr:flavin reductase family protein [Steroidobacteraceae bacterium]